MSAESSVAQEILAILEQSPLPDVNLRGRLMHRGQDEVVQSINGLLRSARIQIDIDSIGTLVYRLVPEGSTSLSLLSSSPSSSAIVPASTCDKDTHTIYLVSDDMTAEEAAIFRAIEEVGNTGIWLRDLRERTRFTLPILNAALKALEEKAYIKSVRSVESKSKKLYMLLNATPPVNVIGGVWYHEQEFDHGYVFDVSNAIVAFVSKEKKVTGKNICSFLSTGSTSANKLTADEVAVVIQTLVYDGRLETITMGSVVSVNTLERFYAIPPAGMTPANFLSSAPCGVCPVAARCSVGSAISPEACEYLTKWLTLSHHHQRQITADDLF